MRMELSLSDPIKAERDAFELLKIYSDSSDLETRIKLKQKIVQTSNKARNQGHTFVASIYLNILEKME